MTQVAAIEIPKKLLVIDGYDPAGIAGLTKAGATPAGPLYKKMLSRFVDPDLIDVVEISAAEAPIIDMDDYSGVCWTGSNLFFSETDALVQRHIDQCNVFFEAGIPQFGSCWAAQLAAVAAGGKCALNPKGREFGVARKILLTEAGRAHPMYKGKQPVFDQYISHADIISELPEGAILLASNAFSPVQGLEVNHLNGSFWAFQYHPEYDAREVAALTKVRRPGLIEQGSFKTSDAVDEYIAEMEALNAEHSRHDIRWKLAIDEDLLDEDYRTLEVRNWLEHFFGC